MAKLQVGDRVKVIHNCNGSGEWIGQYGYIVAVCDDKCTCETQPTADSEFIYRITFGEQNHPVAGHWADKELQRCAPYSQRTMGKLTNIARSILDKNLRNMIKAGFMESDLSFTDEGIQAVLADYLESGEVKDRLGIVAKEILKERKEEKTE